MPHPVPLSPPVSLATTLFDHIGPREIMLVIGIILVLVALSALKWQPRYRATPIMTANEWEFFGRIQRALPECTIFAQVAMSALMAPDRRDDKRRLAAFRMISQKRIDYAVFDQRQQLICVVELDDRTHVRALDIKRDGFLASAGITCLRWHSRNKPQPADIRSAVLESRAPQAPTIPFLRKATR